MKRGGAEVLCLLPVLKKWQYIRPRVGVVVSNCDAGLIVTEIP